jgi:hypothetical protein
VRSFATVTVDNHPVNAEAYLGNPTDNEAEAFLLVNINGVGNYLLNLEEETYREVSSREFVHLPGGVVIVGPISKGQWVTPLPFKNLNEFRVSSRGQLVIVKF